MMHDSVVVPDLRTAFEELPAGLEACKKPTPYFDSQHHLCLNAVDITRINVAHERSCLLIFAAVFLKRQNG